MTIPKSEEAFFTTVLDGLDRLSHKQRTIGGEHQLITARHEKEIRDLRSLLAPPGLRTACEAALDEAPELRFTARAIAFRHLGIEPDPKNKEEHDFYKRTIVNIGSGIGAASVPIEVAALVLNLMALYGAWKSLGYVPLGTGKTRVAQVSAEPYAAWQTPSNNGLATLLPGSITGSDTLTDCPTISSLLEIANPCLEDGKVTFEGAVIEALVTSLNKALDWACFSADGSDDGTDGLQTGIFAHSGVTNFSAGAGRVAANTLALADFAGTIGSVSSAALQRACRWWVNPFFLPKLMLLTDGTERILKAPTMPGGEWMLAGFPVTWTAAAPGVDGNARQIAAFGRGESYLAAVARDIVIARSTTQPSAFTGNLTLLRATMRAQAKMQDAASFAVLKTAAA